ncbi:Multidrug resistance-associated protein 1 [Geranomyces michiganensis]|nr:Multidrug resistance-associated protein 1 [Geranomyces michiganensis]
MSSPTSLKKKAAVSAITALPPGDGKPPGKVSRNLFSYVTYSWITPLLALGRKRPLQEADLPNVPISKQAKSLDSVLDSFWAAAAASANASAPSLAGTLIARFWGTALLSFTARSATVAVAILMPLLISGAIAVLQQEHQQSEKTTLFGSIYVYAGVYFALSIADSLCVFSEGALNLDLQVQLRAVLQNAVYRKALRLSPESRMTHTSGTINSLIDVDVNLIAELSDHFNTSVACAAQIALALYFISRSLGVTTYVTAGVFCTLSVIVVGCMPLLGNGQGMYMKALDNRTRLLREFLYGIKNLKMEAMEHAFAERISAARAAQLVGLRKFVTPLCLIFTLAIIQQDFLPTLTIVCFSKLGGAITAENVFTIIGFLAALMMPSGRIGGALGRLMQMGKSFQRLTAFLCAPEIKPDEVTEITGQQLAGGGDSAVLAVRLKNASFTWSHAAATTDKKEKEDRPAPPDANTTTIDMAAVSTNVAPVLTPPAAAAAPASFSLKNLNLEIPQGKLVVVVGSVASGKSSLFSALTGSMKKMSDGGEATMYGTVAYCAQEPWIVSGTVEENILGLFSSGKTSADARRAAELACLAQDLDILPSNLGTRVGEKGVSLSGGQRARVALARAIASDADILLLDDPLAALDARVGKVIFEDTLCGALRHKTRILVTHQLQFAAKADIVVVLDQGRIVETGAFRDLLADKDSRLSFLMSSYQLDDDDNDGDDDDDTHGEAHDAKDVRETLADEARQTVAEYEAEKEVAEDRRVGTVGLATYASYARAAGWWSIAWVGLLWPISTGVAAWQQIQLVQWSGNSLGWSDNQYFNMFWILGVIKSLAFLCLTWSAFYAAFGAGKQFHDAALAGLVNAKMSWLEGEPVGRILNRLTADVQALDFEYSALAVNFYGIMSALCYTTIILAYTTPYMLLGFFAMAVPSTFAFRYFQASYRELKRLSSILKSPLSAHMSESLNGIETISAYASGNRFIARQYATTDLANKAILLLGSARFWISLRLSVLSAFILLLSLLLAGFGVLSPNAVGLSLVTSISLGAELVRALLLLGEVEATFNAVERLDHYSKNIPAEASAQRDAHDVSADWPRAGEISIRGLEVCYSTDAKAVISDLTLDIAAGEHVALVGRTGAGKSSLMLALFRIIEPSAGSILIDGVDIATLSLATLRGRPAGLTIIPQEPVLFSGSFRYNLDMSGSRPDDELWAALELTGMKPHVAALPDRLDATISDGGKNLSAGQRQLLCLAKAMLAKPKILVLDEASSAIDAEAHQLLQSAVLKQFANTTVISIAHRLNTVAAFDRVAVLDRGRLVEVGPPADLLETKGGVFAEMVAATGAANAAVIRDIANRSAGRGEEEA